MTIINTTLPDWWIETTLGDVILKVDKKIEVSILTLSNYISTENMISDKWWVIKSSNLPTTWRVSKFEVWDILFSNIRTYFKKLWFSNIEWWVSNDVLIFRGNIKIIDKKFLYFLLSQDLFFDYTVKSAKWTKMPRWDKDAIFKFPFFLPPLPEQQAIAKILSSFDGKIELLKEQNETLEKMAQTIFEEWFGKYGMDDELPEGWRVGKLSDIADFLNGLALQKFPPKNDWTDLPIIKIRELKSWITSVTDFASSNIDKKYIIQNGDILFSWSGSLEIVIWKYWIWALNQHLFKVFSEKYPKWFYYLWTLYHLDDFRNIASNKATTMWHIQRWHLDLAKVIIPDNPKIQELNKIFEPIIQKFEDNEIQIQTLSKTRDELLPKLMKGEMRVV